MATGLDEGNITQLLNLTLSEVKIFLTPLEAVLGNFNLPPFQRFYLSLFFVGDQLLTGFNTNQSQVQANYIQGVMHMAHNVSMEIVMVINNFTREQTLGTPIRQLVTLFYPSLSDGDVETLFNITTAEEKRLAQILVGDPVSDGAVLETATLSALAMHGLAEGNS